MKLIVGLGNPGNEYNNTRHNIGFMVLDNYLKNVKYKEKFNGLYYEKNINNEKVIFLKPQTYMNNSGECVVKYVNFYKIDINDIMIIQDDLDLQIGTIKFKKKSSSGGHNGIKSIISHLKTDDFLRMKVGINKVENINVINYVLGKFPSDDVKLLDFNKYNDAINDFILYDYNYVMNKFNRK